jgi:hypothetical protein
MSKPEPAVPADGAISRPDPLRRLIEAMALEATVDDEGESALEISADVVRSILEAGSLEEAFAAAEKGLTGGKEMTDVEMAVTDFHVKTGDGKFKTPLGHYMVVEATRLDTGEPVKFSTGAPNVVSLLWKARQEGRLPLECVIRARETRNGELLTLKLLAPRAVRV